MKIVYPFLIIYFLCLQVSTAQVGIGTTNPDASSILELNSTSQGVLISRMTETQRDAISAPATGLLIYQTDGTTGFYYYNSSAWVTFGGGGADNDWTISGNDMYNANTGNVGVGNTSPTATLHITGTSSGGSVGTNTLYSQDFSALTIGDVTSSVSTNEYQIIAGAGNDVWEVVSPAQSYASVLCTGCTGQWINIRYDCTSQEETFVTGQFTSSATATSLDIAFDYRYRYEDGSDEAYNVTLYNETDNAIASTLIALTNTSANTAYSGTFNFSGTNIATDTYSLRFQYIGNCDYGASLDNISVIENTVAAPTNSVFRLEDGTQQAGYVLTSDANGNATWQVGSGGGGGTDSQTLSISGNNLTISNGNTVTLPSGGGGSVDAENGLTESGGTVRLGGALTQTTYIDLNSRDLYFEGTGSGDITFEDNSGQPQMTTNFAEGYTNFGKGGAFVDGDDGMTFTDSGGDTFTREFVAGFYKGSSGGTSIAMGSIEYFVDGKNELLFKGSGIHPLEDEMSQFGNTLGASSRRWGAVYATNGVITTSDISVKKNITPLNYGLKEIIQLETISYNWKDNTVGKTVIPDHLTKKKIGFSAQQLLNVLPEVVQTHSWTTSDEEGNYKRIKNEKLGVYYSDIIPVTVKAIQEQQEQIVDLKNEVETLKNELENLKKLILSKQ